ncbi:MAG TPA: glycosyltransferase family 4 protein [Acidimicrobiales bacterium]|nr:glycosyltransferase family 4 protein [Acidimicrobiales bacterium]
MRILIYNWRDMAHPRAGGAEVYTHNVAKHWVEWGHEVTWFTSAVEGRPSVEEVDRIKIVRRGGRFGVYREARRFYEREGKGHFDIVVDVVNTRPFLCPKFVRDVPVVALIFQVCREVWFYEVPFPIAVIGRYFLEPRWLRVYRDVPVMTISESSRASLADYGLSNVSIVPVGTQGVELPSAGPKEAEPTVVFVGRLTANKRPSHALRATEIARVRLPDLRAWVIGSGPQEQRLQGKHAEATFFGRVSEKEKLELMSRAHVIVATSVREGWGMTISEAATVGTPAVAYDVPGLRDSVAGSGGYLVEPNPESLAADLVRRMPEFRSPGLVSLLADTVSWATVASAILSNLAAPSADSPNE